METPTFNPETDGDVRTWANALEETAREAWIRGQAEDEVKTCQEDAYEIERRIRRWLETGENQPNHTG